MIVKNFYKMKTSRKGKVELETDPNRVINKRNSFCITGLVVLIPINKTKNVVYSNELIYFKLKGALIQLCCSLACWAIGWGERQLFPPTKLPLSYSLTSLTFRWILSYFWLTELLQFPELDRTLEKDEILFYSMIGKLERSARNNFLICSLCRYSLSGCNLLFVVILFNFS